MLSYKWLVIARTEYKTRTSSIRSIRRIFPFIVIGILAIFVFYIAPAVVGFFINDVVQFFLSQAAVVLVPILFLMLFLLFMWFPIAFMLRDVRSEQQMILASAPVHSRDLLLGEFLGELPLYLIMITVVTGFFTALFDPLGISFGQKAVIVILFAVILSLALWIGTVIAAVLRTKLGRSSRGKDIAKAISLLLVVPFIGILYAFMGGGILEALADPESSELVKGILSVVPSSWAADIVVLFANHPGSIGSEIVTEVVSRLAGIIILFGGSLLVGTRLADRAYSMETTSFAAAKAGSDGIFYKAVKYVGGNNSFGILLASTFKVYVRRFQNLSWILYVMALVVLMNVFLMKPQDPFPVFLVSSFVFPMLAVAVASDVTLRGKETLFIFKKTPSGVKTLIKTRLVQGWMIAVVLAGVVMGVSVNVIPGTSMVSAVGYTGAIMVFVAAHIVLALGLFLLRPVYNEKGGEFMMNLLIPAQGSAFLVLGSLIVFGERGVFLIVVPVTWVVGVIVLLLGKRRFTAME